MTTERLIVTNEYRNAQQALYNVDNAYPDDYNETLEDAVIALRELMHTLSPEFREVYPDGSPFVSVMESTAYMGPTRNKVRLVSQWVDA